MSIYVQQFFQKIGKATKIVEKVFKILGLKQQIVKHLDVVKYELSAFFRNLCDLCMSVHAL